MIYCVEDDKGIRDIIIYTLTYTGFKAQGFDHASALYAAIKKEKPEMILLDIMLPQEDGIEILKKIRGNIETKKIPVIMITAKGTEYDKIIGLDNGADDYITKPFGMMEMVSRIKAVLRRSEPQEEEKLEYKGVCMNINSHKVTAGDREIELTLKEFKILELLLKHIGTVYTRDMLLENIWGYDFEGETRTVDVHIRTLRAKLGDYGSLIETIRGVGYRI